jgi:subtilase family serine protease
VLKIEREKDGIAGETYRVKVTVINKGGAASPPDQAWGTALTSAPGLNGWPEMVPMHLIPALAPGETYVFRIGGSVLAVAHSWVEIFLDVNRLIQESDETNNFLKTEI